MLRPYVAFHAALRSAYQSIVGSLEEHCRVHVQHHLDAATSEIALSSFGSDAELSLKQLQLGALDELENAVGGGPCRAGLLLQRALGACACVHCACSWLPADMLARLP